MKAEYTREGVILYLGDCLDVMESMDAKSVDHTITDPPYNERTHQGALTFRRNNASIDDVKLGVDEFEPLADVRGLVDTLLRVTRRWNLCFCSIEEMTKFKDPAWEQEAWVRAGVWDRVNPAPQFTGDRPSQACDGLAIFHSKDIRKRWNGGGKAGIWRCSVEIGKKIHPTQKPLKLMLQLVADFTDPAETIFDPYMGSGTTGVAALQLGRQFIGIEKNPVYFEMAVKRIEATLKQPALFQLPAAHPAPAQAGLL